MLHTLPCPAQARGITARVASLQGCEYAEDSEAAAKQLCAAAPPKRCKDGGEHGAGAATESPLERLSSSPLVSRGCSAVPSY